MTSGTQTSKLLAEKIEASAKNAAEPPLSPSHILGIYGGTICDTRKGLRVSDEWLVDSFNDMAELLRTLTNAAEECVHHPGHETSEHALEQVEKARALLARIGAP